MSMWIGACTWPINWNPPYEDAIKKVAELGFKSTELAIWNPEQIGTYYTPQRTKDLRRLAEDLGLKITSVFYNLYGKGSPDAAVRAESVENFKRGLDVLEQLGCPLVNTHTAYPFDITFPNIFARPFEQEFSVDLPRGLDWKQNFEDQIDVLRQMAQACEAQGSIRMSIEPHPWRLVHNSAGMLRVIEHVQSPAIGLNLDPSHLFPMGELAHMIAYEVGDRVFHTHFSDNDGRTNVHWRPGKGQIDWHALVRALDDIGYSGPLSIELEDVPGSAGPTHRHRNPDYDPRIDRQMLLAKEYIERVCEEEGVRLEK